MDYAVFTFLCAAVAIAHHAKYRNIFGSTFLVGVIGSLVSFAFTPLLLTICGIFAVYRMYVKKRLRNVPGYMGLMEGSDAYWAGEQIYARSIVNILLMVDFSKLANEDGRKPIDVIREVSERVIKEGHYKMTCKQRLSKYGYYYLEKCDVAPNENVRLIEPVLLGKADLEKFVSEMANKPIIKDLFWEILVGREEICGSYPVLIRAHHALGDGIALVRLFLDHMIDQETRVVTGGYKLVMADSLIQRLVNGEYKEKAMQIAVSVLNKVNTYIHVSIVLARQFILKPLDKNSLHDKRGKNSLNGKKVCRFMEIDLEVLKEIRRSLNVRFTDVLLTAFSDALEDCFVKWGETVEQLHAIITARLAVPDSEVMANLFTIAMVKLPITGKDKIKKIHASQEQLKKLPDHHVNYWLLRVAFSIFPATLISKYICMQSTLIVSNVPGPREYIKIRGNRLTEMAFFLPNRDTTGVGVSFISYADRFSIGLIVDESVLTNPSQVDDIIEGFVQSVGQMHSRHVLQKSIQT